MNKVILIGNIGNDPETRTLPNGNTITTASLATTETYKNKAGERVKNTQWHNLDLWGKAGEVFAKHVEKGMSLSVEGSIVYQKWDDANGNKRLSVKIKVDNFNIVNWNDKGKAVTSSQNHTPQPVNAGSDEDLPF